MERPARVDHRTTIVERLLRDYKVPKIWKPRWHKVKQAAYVESILMGYPIVPFFAYQQKNHYYLFNGRERYNALSNFLTGNLVLQNTKYLKKYEGTRFDEIPRYLLRNLLEESLLVYLYSQIRDIDIIKRYSD